MASGFPDIVIDEDEILIPESFQEFFGISREEVGNANVTLNFDLLKILLSEDEQKEVLKIMNHQ